MIDLYKIEHLKSLSERLKTVSKMNGLFCKDIKVLKITSNLAFLKEVPHFKFFKQVHHNIIFIHRVKNFIRIVENFIMEI
ncbi:hypothetical protein APS47_11150 [Leptospira kirschneri serovar Mozdok]|nr:hypothetical protein APS47_11150 [Leptospira kirschneri serovar Mozdok]